VINSDIEAWRAQTSGSFSLRMFPGDHFFSKQPLFLRAPSQGIGTKPMSMVS
jgi:surfactin synthase thioesterase subunit